MPRPILPTALDIIKKGEGLRLASYLDPAGIWTIGYGHTPASEGQQIDQAEADRLLAADVAHAAGAVERLCSDVATSDVQFSAMVSLAFNIGIGAFEGSTVLRRHRAGAFVGAGAAFLLWNKAHVRGRLVELPGLIERRRAERALYLKEEVGA